MNSEIFYISYPITDLYSVVTEIMDVDNAGHSVLTYTDEFLLNPRSLLTTLFPESLRIKKTFEIINHDDLTIICFVSLKSFPIIGEIQLRKIGRFAELLKTKQKLAASDGILDCLNHEKLKLHDLVKYITEFTYSCHCSIWAYNEYTKFCVCLASDNAEQQDVWIDPEEKSNTVLEFVTSERKYEAREVKMDAAFSTHKNGMRSITFIRVLFDSGTVGVVTVASKHPRYYVRKSTSSVIRSLTIHAHNTEYLPLKAILTSFDQTENSVTNKDDSLFWHEWAEKIARELRFEACTIFMRKKHQLVVVASYDAGGHVSGVNVKYPLDEQGSLTVDSFIDQLPKFSYDISKEKKNSNKYTEQCDLPHTSWIAYPILVAKESVGVIRVKNKYQIGVGGKQSKTLRSSDFWLLSNLTYNLSSVIAARAAEEELHGFKYHTRVFLHEVRTPVQSFIDTPKIVGNSLVKKFGADASIQPLVKRLSDLESLASRLQFLVACQRREHLFRNRKNEKLSLMRDIVMPVIQTYKPYVIKKYDIEIQLDDMLLRSRKVWGDIYLFQIAFNILIDNAAKYSKSKKPIFVRGEISKNKKIKLIVENDGYSIREDEKDLIFEDGYRGVNIRKLKIDGTGVGLELARDIALKMQASVSLLSSRNPVIFEIEFQEADYD